MNKATTRMLKYPPRLEMAMAKYDDPTMVQFHKWADISEIDKIYNCTLIKGGKNVLITENDTAAVMKLTYGGDIAITFVRRLSQDAEETI